MKLLKLGVLLFVVGLGLVSCKSYRLERKIEAFMQHPIVVPQDIDQIQSEVNDSLVLNLEGKIARLIVYVDSVECSSCKVGHMHQYDEIIDYQKTVGDQYLPIFIFNPPKHIIEEFLRHLRLSYFDYPILLDEHGLFPRANPHIPTDLRLHTFLLDRDGKVVLVGDPSRNPELWELYKKTITELIENDGIRAK
jgi:hypothetical protein